MSDYAEYTIDDNGYQGNGNGYHGNGYDQLQGDYALFYKVAKGFVRRVKLEDREDFLHDLFLAFAKVKASYQVKGKELTEGGLMRVAQYELADYWRKHFKRINGIDCSRCSATQREKCKDWYLYPDCPKAVKTERLDKLVEDGNGNGTRPDGVPCEYETICESCPCFSTTIEFLPVLNKQKQDAENKGQTQRVEVFARLIQNMDKSLSEANDIPS